MSCHVSGRDCPSDILTRPSAPAPARAGDGQAAGRDRAQAAATAATVEALIAASCAPVPAAPARDAACAAPERRDAVPWDAIEALRPVWIRRTVRAGLDPEDAEDLFQEALLAALQGLERLRVAEGGDFADAFFAWFWGILRHKQISELRRRRRVRAKLEERGPECYPVAGRDTLATLVRSSLGLLEAEAPAEARVLRKRFMEGKELKEMAADLGVSVPTACRRVQAALRRLRGCIFLVLP